MCCVVCCVLCVVCCLALLQLETVTCKLPPIYLWCLSKSGALHG